MQSINQLSYRNELLKQLRDPSLKKERKYIIRMLLIAVQGLYLHGIYIFPNIIEQFKINGYKRTSLYFEAIINIADIISKKQQGNVEWIGRRTLKKSNTEEKNIIICFLLFNYRESFINYLNEFLLNNNKDKGDTKNLISNLQRILRQVPIMRLPKFHPSISKKNDDEEYKLDNLDNEQIFNITEYPETQNICDIEQYPFNEEPELFNDINDGFDMF